MVLYHRKPIPRIPLPRGIANGQAHSDTQVFYCEPTNEIFLNYDDYAARMLFLRSRVFTVRGCLTFCGGEVIDSGQCEATGQSGLDYVTALKMEQEEHQNVHARFPGPLKGRTLRAVHLRVHQKLESLVDIIYERYHDRFFENERCFVEISGQKYFGMIARVYPPPRLAELARTRAAAAGHPPEALLPQNVWQNSTAYGAVAHAIGTDLDIDADEADKLDDMAQYIYIIRLMDESKAFGGSTLEAKGNQLSRDRQTFSKSLLKRYLRETCTRDAHPNAPWRARSKFVAMYGLPATETPEIQQRNERLVQGHLAKRKQIQEVESPASKRRREHAEIRDTLREAARKPGENGQDEHMPPKEVRKVAKYPTEDLDLDALSVLDGRVRRRAAPDLPPLPTKPKLGTELDVDQSDFERLLTTWAFLNTFGEIFQISSFSLDDYVRALKHPVLDPLPSLLGEVHGVLINEIISAGLRLQGTTTVTSSGLMPLFAAERQAIDDGMSQEEREQFVRRGLVFARKWDRSARLKNRDGRIGWQRYLIGALCQRGALECLPTLPRILKHLFAGDHGYNQVPVEPDLEDKVEQFSGEENAEDDELTESEVARDEGTPPEQYLSLPMHDKLAILHFLCDLCMSSKKLRSYLDVTEQYLTDLRKQRNELHRAKRALSEQRSELDSTSNPPATAQKSQTLLTVDNGNRLREGLTPESAVSGNSDDGEHSVRAANGGGDTRGATMLRAASEEASLLGGSDIEAGSSNEAQPRMNPALSKSASRKQRDTIRKLDDEISANLQSEEDNERDFRRCKEVSRLRPLGQDRFYNTYWWLDGIGSMTLTTPTGGYAYGAGRVFVQGPTPQEWAMMCTGRWGDEKVLHARREFEEGDEATRVGVNEWAALSTEAELDQLIAWLNIKGVREVKLRDNLMRWRPYIVGGMIKRHRDLRDPFEKPTKAPPMMGDRRSARIANEAPEPMVQNASTTRLAPMERYLAWTNKLAVT